MTVDRGDLVWVDSNPQRGHEQAGRRPALVISPAAYNGVSNCTIVCPVTSNPAPWPWKVRLPEGGEITGAVLVDQVKSIDCEARRMSPSGHRVGQEILGEVLAKLATLTG